MSRMFAFSLLVLVALTASGCGCNRPLLGLFNRGDSCAPACGPSGYAPGPGAVPYGGPVTTGLPQVLPGPIEVGPIN